MTSMAHARPMTIGVIFRQSSACAQIGAQSITHLRCLLLRGWGSPTILVNGEDVVGNAKGEGVGCRVYDAPGGVPTPEYIATKIGSIRPRRVYLRNLCRRRARLHAVCRCASTEVRRHMEHRYADAVVSHPVVDVETIRCPEIVPAVYAGGEYDVGNRSPAFSR